MLSLQGSTGLLWPEGWGAQAGNEGKGGERRGGSAVNREGQEELE